MFTSMRAEIDLCENLLIEMDEFNSAKEIQDEIDFVRSQMARYKQQFGRKGGTRFHTRMKEYQDRISELEHLKNKLFGKGD